jgi:lysophospholipase L1-like esterase
VQTEPDAVRVLCFGDSNTHGASDDDPEYTRQDADRRWTGLLQKELGERFEVVEEGLGGRTTDLDRDGDPACNGRRYFAPCLLSHNPLDVVVVMLGTNDLQTCFDRTPSDVAAALAGYVDDVAVHGLDRQGRVPTTVLVSPIAIDGAAPRYAELTAEGYDLTSVTRSEALSGEVRRVAGERGAWFVDAASVARAGADGLHLAPDSAAPLAAHLADVVGRVVRARTLGDDR